MPSVFQGLQDIDQRRIKCMKVNMKQSTEIECRVYPIVNKCLDGIQRAADEINEHTVSNFYINMNLFHNFCWNFNIFKTCLQDSELVVDRFKSGLLPPEDIPFEDLSAIKNGEAPPIQSNGYGNSLKPDSQSLTYKGTLSAGKSKKRSGLFGIFGNTKVGSSTTCLYTCCPFCQI